MAERMNGLEGTTTMRVPSSRLPEMFKLTDEGNLIIRDEALARLIAEQTRAPQTAARAATEVEVSVKVKF